MTAMFKGRLRLQVRAHVLVSPAFWALMLSPAHSLLVWINPDWMHALPELIHALLVLPFVPAMILFNTETPPAWTNYTLVPASAFVLSWMALSLLKRLVRWFGEE